VFLAYVELAVSQFAGLVSFSIRREQTKVAVGSPSSCDGKMGLFIDVCHRCCCFLPIFLVILLNA